MIRWILLSIVVLLFQTPVDEFEEQPRPCDSNLCVGDHAISGYVGNCMNPDIGVLTDLYNRALIVAWNEASDMCGDNCVCNHEPAGLTASLSMTESDGNCIAIYQLTLWGHCKESP